jgi:membrane associated rhomboid family serine protease
MLIPLRDDNLIRNRPAATIAIIAACVVVFLFQLSLTGRGQRILALGYGMIPSVLFGTQRLSAAVPHAPPWLTILTSMFLHGGFLHIIGNMVYLWVFGQAMEDALGSVRFVIFYLLCGVAAALTQAFVEPAAAVPMIGASGAISGVLGGYLVLFPRARILVLLIWGLITPLNLPAKALLLWWIAIQVISILISTQEEGGVAWYAHVGGFATGMALVWMFRPQRLPQARTSPWTRTSPWGRRRGPWG